MKKILTAIRQVPTTEHVISVFQDYDVMMHNPYKSTLQGSMKPTLDLIEKEIYRLTTGKAKQLFAIT